MREDSGDNDRSGGGGGGGGGGGSRDYRDRYVICIYILLLAYKLNLHWYRFFNVHN